MEMTEHMSVEQLTELILKIVALPDEKITEAVVDEVIKQMEEAIYKEDKNKILYEMAEQMKKNITEAHNGLKELETLTQDLIDELQPLSKEKEGLIRALMDCFISLMREAIVLVDENYDTVVHFELIREGAKLPTYAHDEDAGADIYAPEDITIPAHAFGFIAPTGLKMAMPRGWKMDVRPRSGLSHKTKLRVSNSPGTIESNYRNEVGILFDNFSDEPYIFKAGERMAQFVISKSYRFKGMISEDVSSIGNDRGGGFGSSGN